MGCEPGIFSGRPCDWPGCAVSTNPSVSFAQLSSRIVNVVKEEGVVRAIGMDVHRDFCEVAIAQAGTVRSAGRIETRPAALELSVLHGCLHPSGVGVVDRLVAE